MTQILDQIERAVNEIDGSYAPWHRANLSVHRKRYEADLFRIKEIYRSGDILEVGAAPCHFTAALALSGYPVVGVDIAPERARLIIDRFGLQVLERDIERQALPFPDERFDCVVCAEVFEHLRFDPLFVLSEINRVMAPGGRLLFTTPNLYAAQNILRFVAGRGLRDPVAAFAKIRGLGHMGHVREYSTAEIRRFLAQANFTVTALDFEHYHYPKGWKGRIGRAAFKVLPRRFRTFQIVVAEKTSSSPGLSPLP
jgi:SAM-dependent methyltransferase